MIVLLIAAVSAALGWCARAFTEEWVNRRKQGWQNPPVQDSWVKNPKDRWPDAPR